MIISVNFCHLAWRQQQQQQQPRKITITTTRKTNRHNVYVARCSIDIDQNVKNAVRIFICKSRMKITNRTWCYNSFVVVHMRAFKAYPLSPPPYVIHWWTDNTKYSHKNDDFAIYSFYLGVFHPFTFAGLSLSLLFINSNIDQHHVVMAIFQIFFFVLIRNLTLFFALPHKNVRLVSIHSNTHTAASLRFGNFYELDFQNDSESKVLTKHSRNTRDVYATMEVLCPFRGRVYVGRFSNYMHVLSDLYLVTFTFFTSNFFCIFAFFIEWNNDHLTGFCVVVLKCAWLALQSV